MSEATPSCRRHLAVVVDAERRHVLVVRDADGWALPSWAEDAEVSWTDAAAVDNALRRLLGLEALTLRPLRARDDVVAHEAEPLDPSWRPPPHARWADRGEIRDPLLRAAVDDGDPLRPPWGRATWYAEVERWIDRRLEELGRGRTGPPRQVRTWSISSVMRVPTAQSDVWFKAVPDLFAREPAVTRELAAEHERRLPAVLAVDLDRRWLLMDDFGGTRLEHVDDRAIWEDTVGAYARLQIAWIGRTDRLLELGCADRRLDRLSDEVEPTLADPLLAELPGALTDDERADLPALAELLHDAIDRLRALDVPETLEHGDLNPGNIRIRPDGPLFFDWTDACVAPAPFCLPVFLEQVAHDGDRLRDAYLEPWGDRIARDAIDLCRLVGHFHQAVTYRRIAHATEPQQRWELSGYFPVLVRGLLGWEARGA